MYIFKTLVKRLILILLFVLSTVSCNNKKIVQPLVSSSEVVWQYSNYLDDAHGGNESNFTISDFSISRIGGSLTFSLVSYPIIGKDYTIVMDKEGVIARINSTTKKADWKSIPEHKSQFSRSYLNGGLAQKGEKIYATYGTNLINCIDSKTGKLIWSKTLQEAVRAYPIVFKGTVFLQTLNNGLYALDAENGKVAWYKAGLDKEVSVVSVISPILYTNKNWIIIQGSTGNLTIINSKTGFEEWAVDSDDTIGFDMNFSRKDMLTYQPMIANDDLYFYSSSGYFYKLNLQDRRIVWKAKFNINRPFYISNNNIIAIDEMNNLVAINPKNGAELWKANLAGYLENKEKRKKIYWNSPIVINKNVYVLGSKGELLSFNLDSGNFVKAIYKMGYGSYIPPIHVGNKVFIISSKELLN